MPLMATNQLRNMLTLILPAQKPYAATLNEKNENICSFDGISRAGLSSGVSEKRILMYTTRSHEKVYIQFPGIESTRQGNRLFTNDFRPVLIDSTGSQVDDMDFKAIWDVLDKLGQQYNGYADILGNLFLRIAYMIDYHRNVDQVLTTEAIDMATGTVTSVTDTVLTWNSLDFSNDVKETLNNLFDTTQIPGITYSFEAFLYYNDLLAQNEDCKYHFLRGANWDVKTGRINNCLSHLTILSHIRGKIGVSKLIDSFQRTGVAPLPQSRFSEACGSLVQR